MKNVEKKIALLLLFIATSMSAQIGVGTKTPHPDAMLEVVAANKGILLPRVALTATTSVAPLSAHVVGMTVYNTATIGDVSPGYYYNDGVKWIKLGTGQGTQGVAGADGKSILNGTTSPSAFVGTDGDFYINTISNTIFGPKVSGAWPLTGISIVGATGVKGDKGDQGEVGPAGSDATVTGSLPISVASGVVSLIDDGISTTKLADGAVTTDKIENGAVSVAKLSLGTATTGQVLKFDGTTWAPAADAGLTTTTVSNAIAAGALTTTVNGVAATTVTLPVADGSETKINQGTNVTITGAGTTASPYVVNSAGASDATTTTNGIVRLAGDLSGTSELPRVANDAITSSKILDGTIAAADLATNSITTDKIENGAVSIAKLSLGTATTGQVLKFDGTTWAPAADAGLTTTTVSNAIAAGALTTTVNGVAATTVTLPVADGSETKINQGTNVTITGAGTTASPYVVNSAGASDATTTTNGIVRLAGDLSGTSELPRVANDAITSSKILDGTIAAADLATNSITTDKIENGAVSIAKLSLGTATTGQVLKFDGTTWAPAADAGLTTTTVSNAIAAGALTTTVNGVAATTVTLPVADGSETKINQGTNVTITGAGTTASPYVVTATDATTATNGLLLTATGEIKLGGNLTEATTINLQDNNLNFTASTGNLGIGTSSPSQKLHVNGGALVSSLAGSGNRTVIASSTGILSTLEMTKILRASSNITLPSDKNFNTIFIGLGEGSDGSFVVSPGSYEISGVLHISNILVSSNVHLRMGIANAPEVTTDEAMMVYYASRSTGSGNNTATPTHIIWEGGLTSAQITGAGTQNYAYIHLNGSFLVTSGGKIFPSFQLGDSGTPTAGPIIRKGVTL